MAWEMAKSDRIRHTGKVRSNQALKRMERRIENYIHIIRYALEIKLSLLLPSSDTKKNETTQKYQYEKKRNQGMGYLDFFPLLDPLGPSSPPPN